MTADDHRAADAIELRGLRVAARCGILPEERSRTQPFEIDLDVFTDVAAAARSDDLADTVDYGALCHRVTEVVAARHYDLMERFATAISAAVLEHPAVDAVTVVVRKLRPPVPEDLATSGVRVHRRAPARS